MPLTDPIPQTHTDWPVALLPVRLETRFVRVGAATELWIRVFPIAVHADAHEPAFTEDEASWGTAFWNERLRQGSTEAAWRSAWSRLTGRFGVERTAWIARIFNPANTRDAALRTARRTGSWTRPARTTVLPHRWVALGYKITPASSSTPRIVERIFETWGTPIKDEVCIGPSPTYQPPPATLGEFHIEPDLKWMVDFETARLEGMALKVALAPPYTEGFDRLLVVGVKQTVGATAPATPAELAAASKARLEQLLDAHHYTDGLGFVHPGTPTNNSTDEASGYATGDDIAGSYAIEVGDTSAEPAVPADSYAAIASKALGIAPARLARVRHGRLDDGASAPRGSDAERLHAALWPATWGYYLEQMMAGAIKDPPPAAVMRDVRCRYIKWVRGGGPLPTLRVGNEPYGVLPATTLDRWEPRAGDLQTDARTTRFLRELRDNLWLTSVDDVPRVGAKSDRDEHATLVRILGMDGRSSSYAARSVVGSQYADYMFGFLEGSRPDVKMDRTWWDRMGLLTQYVRRTKLDITDAPRLTEALYADFHYSVRSPLVRAATADSRLEPASYIDTLLRLDVMTIRANVAPDTTDAAQPTTLFYALLRHATLLAYTMTARAMMATRVPAWLEPELIGLPFDPDVPPPPTPWWFLEEPRDPATTRPKIGEYLGQVKESEKSRLDAIDITGDPVRAFVDFWQSLTYLKNRPAAVLEHFLVDALDVSAHRLDAWITSFATQRLATQRASRDGLYIGGYGVLVDVRPRATAPPRRGFIHAPSMPHATMAAILRSGFLSHAGDAPFVPPTPGLPARITCVSKRNRQSIYDRIGRLGGMNADGSRFELTLDEAIAAVKRGVEFYVERPVGDRVRVIVAHSARGFEHLRTTADGDEPNNLLALEECAPGPEGGAFAVDLSSGRVRRALRILDGVRQGQTLGALLGYRFERGLHEAALDEFIAVFREIAPLVAGKMTLDGTTVQSLPAANVVDGLALSRQSREPPGLPWGSRGLPRADPDDVRYMALAGQLLVLDDTMDALSDLLLAESVYHIARGNPLRSGATLDAIGRGDAPPPELECVRTPRAGVGITHRLAVMFNDEPEMPASWGTAVRPRASAELILNAWAGRLIGDPSRFACRATFVDAENRPVAGVEPQTVRLSALGLSPLDLVYMAETEQGAQRAELEQRVAYHALRNAPTGVPPGADVELDFGPHPDAGMVAFDAFRETARALRAMIAAARPVASSDLVGPDAASPAPGVDLADLARRSDEAVRSLRERHDALQPIVATADPSQVETLRARLLDLSYFGIDGAIPLSARGDAPDDLQVLTRQAQSVLAETRGRLEAADALAGLTVSTVDLNLRLTRVRDAVRQSDAAELERIERWATVTTGGDTGSLDRGAAEYRLAILREVFIAGFRVLPRLQPAGGASLATALGASDALQGADKFAAHMWLQRVSRVREATARLDAVLQYAEALNPGTTIVFRVAQLPYVAGEPWVALAAPAGRTVQAGRVSLVVHTSGAPYAGGWLAGLHVDEFAEVVPNATELTAVAFPADRPGARAPQAILLAVSPHAQGRAWDLDTLAAIVQETIDLATIRAVDIDALESIGHYLPALHFAINEEHDTVSTDFQRLAARRT